MTEKQLQDDVVELASYCGWEHQHQYDSRRSDPGWPDLVLCRPPELLIVELKSDRGRLSRDQKRWLDRLQQCGVEVAVWRPRDWEQIVARLQRRYRGTGSASSSAKGG